MTIKRTRVKDAVNPIWWLSKCEHPQPASVEAVQQVDAPAAAGRVRRGHAAEPTRDRPALWRDNGGAIPPNLMSVEHAVERVYLRRCKAAGVAPHPARFPFEVPEFFVRFLTTEGQLVYDPFAGSNVTGAAAEAAGRRWFSTEIRADYVEGPATGSRTRPSEPPAALAAG